MFHWCRLLSNTSHAFFIRREKSTGSSLWIWRVFDMSALRRWRHECRTSSALSSVSNRVTHWQCFSCSTNICLSLFGGKPAALCSQSSPRVHLKDWARMMLPKRINISEIRPPCRFTELRQSLIVERLIPKTQRYSETGIVANTGQPHISWNVLFDCSKSLILDVQDF